MKFCKLFRFFNHTLQNQKRRNSYVDVTSSHRGVFCEKGVLKNLPDFTGKHLCWNLFLVKLNAFSGLQIYQNKNRLQYRFFCEIFKNTYFEEHLRTTASKLLFREKPHWLNKMRFIDIANTFHKDRSSRLRLFCKNVVFKKFTKFTIKQLCRSLALQKAARRSGHTGKVGPGTLRLDPGLRTLRWDPRVGQ